MKDGRLGNKQRILIEAGLEPNPPEAARTKHRVFVGEFGSKLNCAGLGRNLAIHQDDFAFLRVSYSVCLDEFDCRAADFPAANHQKEGICPAKETTLADAEVGPDRIHLRDGSHVRGRPYQVSYLGIGQAGDTGDG